MEKRIFIITIFCLVFTIKSFSLHKEAGKQNKPQRIYLNYSDTVDAYLINEQTNSKGQILLRLSLPYLNNFQLSPLDEPTKSNTGFMGYSIGLGYFYKPNQYVNLSYSHIQDFYLPVAFVDRGNEYELMSSGYLSLSNNHTINRLSLAYGFSFVKNSWDLRNRSWDESNLAREPIQRTNKALGLIFSSHFQLTPIFHLGVIYRPTFYRLNIEPKFKYEHSISIDFALKILL